MNKNIEAIRFVGSKCENCGAMQRDCTCTICEHCKEVAELNELNLCEDCSHTCCGACGEIYEITAQEWANRVYNHHFVELTHTNCTEEIN